MRRHEYEKNEYVDHGGLVLWPAGGRGDDPHDLSWATGGKISPIACLMEILLLLLISFFCSNKNRKKQEEARLSGPLVTEERQKQAKKGQKEPIVICPEGKPYLIAAIGFYVVFLVSAIAMLVWFSWPKVLLSGTLGGICLYDLYKYMRIKTDIAAAKDREAFLQRKKQARREALKLEQAPDL